MKIIKNGDKSKVKNELRFKCNNCGCIFISDKEEYDVKFHNNENYYSAVCPECGRKTTVDEFEHEKQKLFGADWRKECENTRKD